MDFYNQKIDRIKFFCASIMSSLSNLAIQKIRNIAKLRNVDGYEDMSREQPEPISTQMLAYIPTPN